MPRWKPVSLGAVPPSPESPPVQSTHDGVFQAKTILPPCLEAQEAGDACLPAVNRRRVPTPRQLQSKQIPPGEWPVPLDKHTSRRLKCQTGPHVCAWPHEQQPQAS